MLITTSRFALCPFLLSLAALIGAVRSVPAGEPVPPDLSDYVDQVRQRFDVPGIAVSIVRDGEVVYAQGSGVRRAGSEAAVDADTVFGIASNSKAFTTALLAMLADEKKLAWDDPVTKHLPAFALHDPWVTRELTVRDLVCHRSGLGLGAGDLLWWPATKNNRDEIVAAARHVQPASSFRSRYAYNNLLFLVAGEVIEAAGGKSWDEMVRERILLPAGMTRTSTRLCGLQQDANAALPHAFSPQGLQPLEPVNVDNIGPAASINSSVNDLARWMIVQLAGGELPADGQGEPCRLFSAAQSQEMWSPQTIRANPDPHPSLAALKPLFSAYGLGWGITDYCGYRVISHTGGLPGYVTRVTLLPELKLGVAVLTNGEIGEAFNAVSWRIVDHYTGAPQTDWIAAFAEAREKRLADAEDELQKIIAARACDTQPSLPLEKYAGRYRDAWYGEATIRLEDGKLVLRFERTELLTGDLEHWHYDTFAVRWRHRWLQADAFASFALDSSGGVEQLKMRAISPLTDFSFDFHDLLFTPIKP